MISNSQRVADLERLKARHQRIADANPQGDLSGTWHPDSAQRDHDHHRSQAQKIGLQLPRLRGLVEQMERVKDAEDIVGEVLTARALKELQRQFDAACAELEGRHG